MAALDRRWARLDAEQEDSRCAMAGKTVAATDWEGAAAAPLRLSLTLEDRNKSTRPSVLLRTVIWLL